ncbi:hypothetical protein D3C73_1178290 [compost metagenome]
MNWPPVNTNNTANSTKVPSPAQPAPNTRRNTIKAAAKAIPSPAMAKPTMLSSRNGVVVMQVIRSNIRLTSRIGLYLDSPCSRSAWVTSISVVWRAKLLARIGMKVLRSRHASMASTIERR